MDRSQSRVAMQGTVNGTTTLTAYIGSIEEVQTSGSTTQITTYYSVGGKRVAADVNGTFYYFGYDALGSQVAVLNATGSLVGAQLYEPYGLSRYNTGTLPTSIGFTGQRADSVTGLDYYNARYYDPGVGQFLSVDSVQGNAQGMDPYAYVGGNPESRTDPTGNKSCYNPSSDSIMVGCDSPQPSGNGSSGNGGGSTTTPTPDGSGSGNGNPKIVKGKKSGITGCGSGTYLQGNQCVSDASSPANKARNQKLSALRHQSIIEEIAGYAIFLLGDILLASVAKTLLDWLEVAIDIVALVATNIVPLIASWSDGSVPSEWYRTIAVLMGVMAGAESIISVLREGSWWAKTGAIAVGATLKAAAGGPISLIGSLVWMFIEPIAGNLLDIGGHALLAKGFADQAEYTRQEDMPINTWCSQYGRCPAGTS